MKLRGSKRVTAVSLVLVLAVLVLAAGCARLATVSDTSQESKGGGSVGAPTVEGDSGVVAPGEPFGAPRGDVATTVEAGDRLVVRTRSMRLQVKSTAEAVDRIRTLVKDHDGVITDLQVATDTDEYVYRYDESGIASDMPLRG